MSRARNRIEVRRRHGAPSLHATRRCLAAAALAVLLVPACSSPTGDDEAPVLGTVASPAVAVLGERSETRPSTPCVNSSGLEGYGCARAVDGVRDTYGMILNNPGWATFDLGQPRPVNILTLSAW